MKRLSFLFSLLVAVLMLTSCGGGIPDYAKLIPKDASIVIRLNAGDIVLETLGDPEACGIDADDPIFIYINAKDENDRLGIVGGIDSESAFTEFLTNVSGEKVQKSGDLNYVSSGSDVIIFNDDWFFIGDAGYNYETWEPNDPKDLVAKVKKRADSGKESIVDTEAFKVLCGKSGMAQAMIPCSFVDDIKDYIDRDARRALRMLEESGFDLSSFALIFDVEMSKGEAKATAEVIAVKEKGEEMIKKMDELAGGSDEGFFLRINFGFLKEAGKNAGGRDGVILGKVAELVKFVEIKYEGDAMVSMRLVSNDDSMTPLAKILEIVAKFM